MSYSLIFVSIIGLAFLLVIGLVIAGLSGSGKQD
ncbi:MAG: hypothetical protein ACI82F_003228 [Planctomycetota bacterium]|jgi:hypothetical protein